MKTYDDLTLNRHSYEVCSYGPVLIYYKPLDPSKKKAFAFQIHYGWTPLFSSTAHCFTKVICQSEVPVVLPATVDVIVQGRDVVIFTSTLCAINEESDSIVKTVEGKQSTDFVAAEFVKVYAANMKAFDERVKVVISSRMTVFCPQVDKIKICTGSEATIYTSILEELDE